jgi:sugar phosphate isomerase/epimerase
MQLVFSPTICPQAQLPAVLELARETGFKSLELFRAWTESTPVHPDWSVRRVREALAAAEMQLTSLNIRNLTGRKADSDERNLGYNVRQLEWDIHLARALGLKQISLKGGARSDEARDDLIEGMNQLLERIPDVSFNLGNHKGNRLQGLEDFQAVMPHLDPRVGVLLDTGHLLSVGEDVIAFAEAYADRIGLVHLRDQKGEKPVPFGQGDLPFEPLLRLLKNAGYTGHLVIELEEVDWADPREALVQSRQYIEDLLEQL